MTKLRVAFITAEMAPYAKAGGLADVAGALPAALARAGAAVTLFLPLHGEIDRERYGITPVSGYDRLTVGENRFELTARLFQADSGEAGLQLYFIEQERFFDRTGIYTIPGSGEPWPDEDERFFFFQEAVLASLVALKLRPHLLHLNDYHTALIPLLLREQPSRYHIGCDPKTLLTIHNLGYQGRYPASSAVRAGLDSGWVAPLAPLEFHGQMNVLKAGIHYADHINTVSPTYAEEIKTVEHGFGLEGVLQERQAQLTGLLNGIDINVWNPAADPHLDSHYTAEDLAGKQSAKVALCQECGLKSVTAPLGGVVSRLVHQKGCDLLLEALSRILATGMQLVILGTGERRFEKALTAAATKYPGRMAFIAGYDNGLAHRIEAGSDLFLMPSRYEPCGLNQLYSLRYGTVPLVYSTGGLRDTVKEWDETSGNGNGFLFSEYDAEGLLQATGRAVRLYRQPDKWAKLQRNGMQEDHSWNNSAARYLDLYRQLTGGT
ncbi:glycogen synthase GlgA [bacterium]|nr:glycogen synthase GlgA [bacterium]